MPEFDSAELGTRFETIETLGAGAGGIVLRCRDRVRENDVAVKILAVGDDPTEFHALRHLNHPGVVAVLDIGRTRRGDRPWFSMELVRGEPFGGGRGEPTEANTWAIRVARLLEATAFLHERGWVHADLKPDNVFVRDDDPLRVCVMDFGLSLRQDEASGLRGTPGFIAPEVLHCEQPSVASDLYSVGVIAASAAMGRLPFRSDDISPGLDGDPPAGFFGLDFPDSALGWLTRMLQKSPNQRPSSAREALASLEAAMGATLIDPEDAATRLAPTELIARTDALADIGGVVRDGGLAIVLGSPGSGRTALLRSHFDSLRTAGIASWLLELGADTSRAQRSLRAFLSDRVSVTSVAPRPSDFDNPTELGQAIRAYEAALAVDLRGAVEAALGSLLLDDLDPETVAGRAALRALEKADPELGVVITSGLADEELFTDLLERRSDPRDVLVRLQPFEVAEVATWLGRALGAVTRADDLASELHDVTDGVPGRLHRLVARLLRKGVLHAGEREWRWTEIGLNDELDDTRQTAPTAMRAIDVDGMLDAACAVAAELSAQGEVTAARRRLHRAVGRAEGMGADAARLGAAWRQLADLSAMMGEGDEAASWYQRIRSSIGIDDAQRAWCVSREAEALQNAGQIDEALQRLDDHRDLIRVQGSPADQARAANTRGFALLKMARYDDARRVADTAREALDGTLSATDRIGLFMISANADWHQGRHSHAEAVCRAALAALPADDEGPVRATVETTLATSLRFQGRYDDAALLYLQARSRYRKVGRLLDCARVANNLGIVHYQRGDWLAAIDAFEDFRELVRRADNTAEETLAWNNLGCLYRDTGQLDRAEDAFDRALELARRNRYARAEPMVLGNLAECSAVRGRTSLAEGQYAKCIALASEREIHDEVVEAWRRVAQMYLDLGESDRARESINNARSVPDADQAAHEMALLDGLEAVLEIGAGSDASIEAVEFVLTQLDEEGSSFEAARLRLRYASALVRVDRYADAEEQLGLAIKVCEPLPARPELARAEELRHLVTAATRNRLDTVTAHYDALQELTLAISRERDLPKLLEAILDRTLELVGEERGYIMLVDEFGEPYLQVARQVEAAAIDDHLHGAGPSKTVTQRVIASRKPLAALDLAEETSLREQMSVVAGGVSSVICVPILRSRDLLGLIYVDSRTAVGGSADHKASLLMACADAASVAIENARLIDALRGKNDAIAIMAHELRTPLSAIIGFASVMLEPGDKDPKEDEELLGIIKREAERTSEMVNRVLQMARMEAGEVEQLKSEVVDPLHVVVSAADSLRPLAAQAEVRLAADAGEDVPDLVGDSDRLVQVAVNLLNNAVKFSPKGGVVGIRVDRADDGGIRLVVQDEGPGIPEDRIQAIFEPYRQAGPKGMRRKGVGLGLAISRQIVKQHRGWIRAENRPDGGAQFTVWLPIAHDGSGDLPQP